VQNRPFKALCACAASPTCSGREPAAQVGWALPIAKGFKIIDFSQPWSFATGSFFCITSGLILEVLNFSLNSEYSVAMHWIRIGVLGINFKTAPLPLREAIARGTESLNGESAIFFPHPTVLLSTCNRTEIYFSADDLAEAHSDLLAYLRGQIKEDFEHRLYSYFGIDCFVHLCRVTAGLDSAIFAETEIQRQVKVAYARAGKRGCLPKCLHYGFQKALKVGKLVRSAFTADRNDPTLYGTLWQMAEWQNKRILLVGNSEINRGFLSFLMHKGIRGISLCTRNPSVVRLEEVHVYDRTILKRWPEYDIVVCASKAEGYLIEGEGTSLIFDLSVPRNVDPQVRGATLYNIDQLIEQRKTRESLEQREITVWENAVKLARIYQIKTLRVPESAGMELRL